MGAVNDRGLGRSITTGILRSRLFGSGRADIARASVLGRLGLGDRLGRLDDTLVCGVI